MRATSQCLLVLFIAASACKSNSQDWVVPQDQQSCVNASHVPHCDQRPPPQPLTVASAPDGPLLAKVQVTSGPCTTPFACSSGCQTMQVDGNVSELGVTCDLVAISTDGRSEAFLVTMVQVGPLTGMCCGDPEPPYSGHWTDPTPLSFDPPEVVVDFDRDGGVATVDSPVIDAATENESDAGMDGYDPTNPPGAGQPCHTHADCQDWNLLCFIEAVTADCQSAPLGKCLYAQTSNSIVFGPCACLTDPDALCNAFPGTACNRVASSTDASPRLSCLACVPKNDGGG